MLRGEGPVVDDLVKARAEIRQGNLSSAETILDTILDRPDDLTSHLLFDITSAYEEVLRAADRYEDLIRITRRCMETARRLPEMDMHIHSAHTLIVIAGAEIALGRKDDAERTVRAAQELIECFPAERFAASSRARVNMLRVRLKSLKKAPSGSPSSVRSSDETPDSSAEAWRTFASQKCLSAKEVKTSLVRLRRKAGPAAAVAIVVEWALSVPLLGSIGASPETFATLVDELASITAAHDLCFDSRRRLSQMVHCWDTTEAPWLQRLISLNRKSGTSEKLQGLRRCLESKVQHAMNLMDKGLGVLESLDAGAILEGARHHDYEAELLRLDSELSELGAFVPPPLSARFGTLQNRMASVIAAVDHEILRRNAAYDELREAVPKASSVPALEDLKAAVKQQLPPAMQKRRELLEAIRQAEDRLLMADLEELEARERATLRAKVGNVRGIDLANLLFRECGIDLQTARRLVIDRNNGVIDFESLLDRVVEINRHRRVP
jgi:hypothetical protein